MVTLATRGAPLKPEQKRDSSSSLRWARSAYSTLYQSYKAGCTDPDSKFCDMVWDEVGGKFAFAEHHSLGCVEGGVRDFVYLFDEVSQCECTVLKCPRICMLPLTSCTSLAPRGAPLNPEQK